MPLYQNINGCMTLSSYIAQEYGSELSRRCDPTIAKGRQDSLSSFSRLIDGAAGTIRPHTNGIYNAIEARDYYDSDPDSSSSTVVILCITLPFVVSVVIVLLCVVSHRNRKNHPSDSELLAQLGPHPGGRRVNDAESVVDNIRPPAYAILPIPITVSPPPPSVHTRDSYHNPMAAHPIPSPRGVPSSIPPSYRSSQRSPTSPATSQ
ncbi:hypothetical protein FRB99_000137 [Tulasnella sp. 403]|nr:hypothetical protein FRB99_000137 [Tulasnella sp. 403]